MDSIIFHIDVNSAFLSWTALERLQKGESVDIRTIPAIIGGDIESRHGVVLAKSIPAKAYHIRTGEPVVSALRKCPNLTVIPPSKGLYSRMSHQLMEHLTTFCPVIEQVSIDECFMDYTPIRNQFASPEEAAHIIKDSVFEKFGFTVNIGISDRKILAKMASDFKKPNLVHTLYSQEIQEKMWPLPVSSLFSCGKSSVDILRKLEILTIGDLAQTDVAILELHLKSHGRGLWEFANGIDSSRVEPEKAAAKGVGNSTTFSKDLDSLEEIRKELLILSESVSARLRKAGQLAGMVSTEIKYFDFKTASHQALLPVSTNQTDLIYKSACQLFEEIWNGTPVRLLGVRTSKLVSENEPVQMSLFDYVSSTPTKQNSPSQAPDSRKLEKLKSLDTALDKIRQKYGKDAVVRGTFVEKK